MPSFVQFALIMLSVVTLGACREEAKMSPDQTYQSYYAKVIEGRSFDEDVKSHTASRREEVIGMMQSRADGDEQALAATKELYLDFTQKLAKCGEITLAEQKIEGDVAQLVYDVEDTCTESASNGQLLIEMVNESGWKIQSDELKISGG